MTNEWIDCTVELPPKDGWYHCASNKDTDYPSTFYYDGIAFMFGDFYRKPRYWKEIFQIEIEKRYGKLKND